MCVLGRNDWFSVTIFFWTRTGATTRKATFIHIAGHYKEAQRNRENTKGPCKLAKRTLDQTQKCHLVQPFPLPERCRSCEWSATAPPGTHHLERSAERSNKQSRCSGRAAALQPFSPVGWRSKPPISHPERSSQLKSNQTPPNLQHKHRLPPPWRLTGTRRRTGDTMNSTSLNRQKKKQTQISGSPRHHSRPG
jgi:hypothetical protein